MICRECSDDEEDESMAQFTKSLRKSKCFSKTCAHESCQGIDTSHIAEPVNEIKDPEISEAAALRMSIERELAASGPRRDKGPSEELQRAVETA